MVVDVVVGDALAVVVAELWLDVEVEEGGVLLDLTVSVGEVATALVAVDEAVDVVCVSDEAPPHPATAKHARTVAHTPPPKPTLHVAPHCIGSRTLLRRLCVNKGRSQGH